MPKKGPNVSKMAKAEKVRDKIAILAGRGMTQQEIAAEVGMAQTTVGNHLRGMTPERKALMEESRARTQERALELVEKHLDTIDEGLKDEKANLGHKAQAFRTLGEIASIGAYNRTPPAQVTAPAMSINLQDPATVKSFIEALRMLNEPKAITVEAVKVEDGA